ncbi:MAG: MBL fold metallo-hydrolase [Armatimonadota bacterium]
MIPALRANVEFLADIALAEQDSDSLHVWWLGQSGFLCSWNGHRIVLDPYLSDSLTLKYANTDKPHVRLSECVVEPSMLDGVVAVASSHMHTDHCDAQTLHPLFGTNPNARLVCPDANTSAVAERIGWSGDDPRLAGVRDGTGVDIGPARFEGIPAAHDEIGPGCLGFLINLGPFRIHHTGDTIPYPGMAERVRPFKPDVSMVPINGRRPERRVAGNLFGDEAARLAKVIGARFAIPCHFDMFAFNTESPEMFVTTCHEIGQEHRVLAGGERLTISASGRV